MKKLLALFLALTLVFSVSLSLTACGETACTEHVDENKDNKCDNCGKALTENPDKPDTDPNNPDNPDLPGNVTGEALANAIEAQLKAASSLKVDFDFSLLANEESWSYEFGKGDVLYENYVEGNAHASIVVSKTEDSFNAKVDVTYESRDDASAEFEKAENYTILYVVDGKAYIYNEELDAYLYEDIMQSSSLDMDGVNEIITTLQALLDGVKGPSEDEIAALKKEIGDFFVEFLNIKSGKGGLSVDLKPEIDKVLGYITAPGFASKTVEEVLNDVLATVNEDLTVDAILTETKTLLLLTVNEALAELDAYLTKNYETTLQGIYDSIVTDESFVTILNNYAKLEGATEDEFNEVLTQIQAVKIADLIKDAGIGDVVLYDLIESLVSGDGTVDGFYHDGECVDEDEDLYCDYCGYLMGELEDVIMPSAEEKVEELFASIEHILSLELEKFELQVLGTQFIDQLKKVAAAIKVNALNSKVDVEFSNGYNLSAINGESNVDIEVTSEYSTDKTDKFVIKAKLTVKIHQLSATPVEIAVPESANKLLNTSGYYLLEGTDEVELEIDLDNECVAIYFYNIGIEVYADLDITELTKATITIPAEDVMVVIMGAETSVGADEPIVITLNTEDKLFTLEGFDFATDFMPY